MDKKKPTVLVVGGNMSNEVDNRYVAFCECVNTYEICIPSEGEVYTNFTEAVQALLEEMPEYSYRHHWMCKVIEITPEGETVNLYFDRTGTSKPSTDQDEWSRVW